MGTRIFATILITLIMVGAVDIFQMWYTTFLRKRGLNDKLIILIKRVTFVILAFLFWRTLIGEPIKGEFAATHFYFALFIYCFYRLISSFYRSKPEDTRPIS